MLLTISTTHRPATDLGYLLHKNPARAQTFELAFGSAHVFYPEATPERCTAALLLDIDPLKLVRGPGAVLTDYVNDRPYVSSSFLSVAIARVFGTAMSGRAKKRQQLAETPIPLEATLAAVPCRGAETLVEDLFAPLGYEVETATDPDDERPRYRNVRLAATKTLAELLNHVYVLQAAGSVPNSRVPEAAAAEATRPGDGSTAAEAQERSSESRGGAAALGQPCQTGGVGRPSMNSQRTNTMKPKGRPVNRTVTDRLMPDRRRIGEAGDHRRGSGEGGPSTVERVPGTPERAPADHRPRRRAVQGAGDLHDDR